MTATEQLLKRKIILGSGSPRRKELLKGLGFNFEVITKPTDESFPDNLRAEEIPMFLAKKKADAFHVNEINDALLITADTIVWVNNTVLNKPQHVDDAFAMLQTLSGTMHQVYTGVCLRTAKETSCFSVETKVFFRTLSKDEITWYIQHYQPFDKAGAYGAQEWIGFSAIERLEGSYFNVMGLPTMEVWEAIKQLSF